MTWSEVWVAGGGPSASAFTGDRLRGKRVVGVNNARGRFPGIVTDLFSLDANWVRRNRALLGTFDGGRYVALPPGTFPDCEGLPGVRYFGWDHADGLSEDPAALRTGCNGGYAAINLCVLMGARDIHLVGYDMDPADDSQYVYWARAFRTMLPQLGRLGVEVTNHNPGSHVDAFRKVVLQ